MNRLKEQQNTKFILEDRHSQKPQMIITTANYSVNYIVFTFTKSLNTKHQKQSTYLLEELEK